MTLGSQRCQLPMCSVNKKGIYRRKLIKVTFLLLLEQYSSYVHNEGTDNNFRIEKGTTSLLSNRIVDLVMAINTDGFEKSLDRFMGDGFIRGYCHDG